MSDSWGNNIKITLFGESHGPAIGITVEGFPAGMKLDMEKISAMMARRAPGQGPLSTPRKEADQPRILSGLYNGRLTGSALCAIIENQNTKSQDYAAFMDSPRPGHADYTGFVRYRGFNDPRGGGHFSGRLTAPLTFAGAIALQYLEEKGVSIAARPVMIGGVWEEEGKGMNPAMEQAILHAKENKDSVGGIIECRIKGIPAGLGAPFFHSVESVISGLMFSIPAVKGVEFGKGFETASLFGSQCNDSLCIKDGKIAHRTNHGGGVQGGITNGEEILFRCAVRPTPTIGKAQETVSLSRREETTVEGKGRHDPCIVPRAIPVVEAAAALALADLWKEKQAWMI